MKQFLPLLVVLALSGGMSFADDSAQQQQQDQNQNQECNFQQDKCIPEVPGAATTEDVEMDAYRPFWECVARDVGYEEHWGGHIASGYNYRRVYYRALGECRHYHANCRVYCRRVQ